MEYLKQNEIKKIYEELMRCDNIFFDRFKPSNIGKDEGIYVIFNSEEKALYVGRTKNLRRRLSTNHLHGNKSTARLKKYLVEDISMSDITDYQTAKEWIKKNCYFKYIKRSDFRERGKIEGMLSFLLDVNYIQEEH